MSTTSDSAQDSMTNIKPNNATVDSSYARISEKSSFHFDKTHSNKRKTWINSNVAQHNDMTETTNSNESFTEKFYIVNEDDTDELDLSKWQTTDKEQQEFFDAVTSSPIGQEQNHPKRPMTLRIDTAFATVSVSELPNYGYEIHQIHLMKPTEQIPIGFKLSKKADSLQYTMTAIVDGSQADKAGLQVNDWLLQIEDKDIRLTDLYDVLKDIYQLFIDQGSVNMVIGRMKSGTYEPERQTFEEDQLFSSVGLSNPIETSNSYSPSHKKRSINQLADSNSNKIRLITLKESSGLNIKSFTSNDDDQQQLHFVHNVQPISFAHRAGLKNYDRILTINNVDVTKTLPKDLRALIKQNKLIQLTVIQGCKQFQALEKCKTKQAPIILTSSLNETPNHQQLKEPDNILFTDEQGPVYAKHCIIKRDPSCDFLGFQLNSEGDASVVHNVEAAYPAYDSGVRDGDIILFVNKRSVQQMSHDNLKSLVRTLVSSDATIDLILINENDLQRYRNYHGKRFIDWFEFFSKLYKNLSPELLTKADRSHEKHASKCTTDDLSSGSVVNGVRTCVVEIVPSHSIGFTVEGGCPPPFRICKIEIDSPADKAGLHVHDSLISINGTSVVDKTYDDTVRIIRHATQQSHIQFVVKQIMEKKSSNSDQESEISLSYSSDEEDQKAIPRKKSLSHGSANAIHLYRKQRARELSYAVRHCHIAATNTDGAQTSSFGFELTEDPTYPYPIVSHVQSKSPGENCGLQNDDILLKVNDRKTKGVSFEKVKKMLDKAKLDGRVEMLVVDKEVYDYCIKKNKKFKEPHIKVKHIFPRRRPSVNRQSLPLTAARNSPLLENIFKTQSWLLDSESSLSQSDLDSPVSSKTIELKTGKESLPAISTTTFEDTYAGGKDKSITDFISDTMNNFMGTAKSEQSLNRS